MLKNKLISGNIKIGVGATVFDTKHGRNYKKG